MRPDIRGEATKLPKKGTIGTNFVKRGLGGVVRVAILSSHYGKFFTNTSHLVYYRWWDIDWRDASMEMSPGFPEKRRVRLHADESPESTTKKVAE